MKILKVFCLTLALFPHCFGLEDSCACGVACEDDQGTADCITENTFGITDEIRDFNKEVCVEYNVHYRRRLDLYLCKFPRRFQFQDYCETAQDGTLVCNIQSPNFNEINQCYPEQTFCAHSVNCPQGTLLLFHHSEMKLTANNINVGTSPSECTDFVKVYETTSIVHTRCGNKTVDYFESPHPLLVTSSSSQCCQSYGYFIWANCAPTGPPVGKRDVRTVQEALHEKFYEEWKKEAELGLLKVLHVDSESAVKCEEYMVSVVKRNEIIEEFTNIKVIMVYAEITDHETYLDLSTQAGKFVGKGILYIGEEMAMFLQQVIPEEIATNEQERAYIQRSLDFLVPFFIRQNRPQVQGFPEDFTVCRFEELFNPLLKNVEFNSPSPFPLIEFPTLLERNQALAEARNNSGSANPFVRSTANLVIQTLSRRGEV